MTNNWDVGTYRSKFENDLPYFLQLKPRTLDFMTSSDGETNQGGHYSRGDTIDYKKVLTGDTIQGGALIKEIRYLKMLYPEIN